MNDHGKSDRPVVLEKPPNKGSGAPQSAEEVEGRGRAKGNPAQQTRGRTQWRETLQHALNWGQAFILEFVCLGRLLLHP